ncbi:MAG: transposase [Candidatus Nanoarchaeia archaeon]
MLQQIILPRYNSKLEEQLINLFHSSNLPLYFNETGYKDFTNYQRISLIVLFKRSKKSIRDFIDELKESKWPSWLDLKRIPKKSTFHDWLKLFSTTLIRKLIYLVTDTSDLKIAAIDGSGIQSNFRSPYYEKRLKDFNQITKDGYNKLDIIVDTFGKKQILDYSFLLKNRNDSFVAKKLLKKIKFIRCKILADKGYPDYVFMDIAKERQNNFVSPPKDYKGKCKHNNLKRRRKEENFQANKLAYKRRPIVETVFSILKRVQDLKLRSRLSYMKKREMGWHILLYNVRRTIVFETNSTGFEQSQIHSFFIFIFIFY